MSTSWRTSEIPGKAVAGLAVSLAMVPKPSPLPSFVAGVNPLCRLWDDVTMDLQALLGGRQQSSSGERSLRSCGRLVSPTRVCLLVSVPSWPVPGYPGLALKIYPARSSSRHVGLC
jgi:MFS superfamily sulfate permease-like transporter